MEYLSLGYIKDSFGLDGTLKVISTTTNAKLRYKKGNKLFILNERTNEIKEFTVDSFRSAKGLDFVKFVEIYSKEEAESFKGLLIVTTKNRNDLSKGEYFYSDLEKCFVYDDKDNKLGKVTKVEEFPAQITLRVRKSDGKDFFVPFIETFIKCVDIENNKIIINVIEGML